MNRRIQRKRIRQRERLVLSDLDREIEEHGRSVEPLPEDLVTRARALTHGIAIDHDSAIAGIAVLDTPAARRQTGNRSG